MCVFCGRQDLRAAGRRGAHLAAAAGSGGHEGLAGVVPGGEEAERDQRGGGGLLHEGGQATLKDGGTGSLGLGSVEPVQSAFSLHVRRPAFRTWSCLEAKDETVIVEENLTPAAYLNSTRNEKGFKARGLVGVCYNPSPLEGDIAPRDLSSALALLTEVFQ